MYLRTLTKSDQGLREEICRENFEHLLARFEKMPAEAVTVFSFEFSPDDWLQVVFSNQQPSRIVFRRDARLSYGTDLAGVTREQLAPAIRMFFEQRDAELRKLFDFAERKRTHGFSQKEIDRHFDAFKPSWRKNKQALAFSAALALTFSYLFPTYGANKGYACFLFCLRILIRFPPKMSSEWLYFGGFAISNILFVGFLALSFTEKTFSRASIVLILIMLLHVLSWPVMMSGWGFNDSVGIGYFSLRIAYIFQTFACIKYRRRVFRLYPI